MTIVSDSRVGFTLFNLDYLDEDTFKLYHNEKEYYFEVGECFFVGTNIPTTKEKGELLLKVGVKSTLLKLKESLENYLYKFEDDSLPLYEECDNILNTYFDFDEMCQYDYILKEVEDNLQYL